MTWCFYACEEVSRATTACATCGRQRPDLLAADAAILGEPTGGLVEAGCQGTLRVRVDLAGAGPTRPAPSPGATPSTGWPRSSAAVAAYEGRRAVLDGCEYAEQLQAVAVGGRGGRQRGPRRGLAVASTTASPPTGRRRGRRRVLDCLAGLLDEAGDRGSVVDAGRRGPAGARPPAAWPPWWRRPAPPPGPRSGWTDVATFWAHGVPAANFGPGDPLLAHHPDERVSPPPRSIRPGHLSCLLPGPVG